jgi:hypothetical protein
MTQMTTGTKVVLVVLVAFAVLFYTGIGLGLMGEGSGPAKTDWIATISGALTPRLDFNALQGSCIDRSARAFTLERKAACQVSIPSASRGTRRITLSLTEGERVEGRYRAPAQHEKIDEDDETADQVVSLEPGKSLAVVILKEGGSLSLTCDAPEKARCRVAAK